MNELDCLQFMASWAVRAMDEGHPQRYEIAGKTNMIMFELAFRRKGNESKRSNTDDGTAQAAPSH